MKTLRVPASADVEAEPFVFEPADRLVPFSVTCPGCRADLLVDEDGDVAYRAHHIGYANETTFELYAVCPHDGAAIVVETYAAPGNPARQEPTPAWRADIPLVLRSRAYRAWESDTGKGRAFWRWFFAQPEVLGWARDHQRAHRKWKARLCPEFTLADLTAAGFSGDDLVLVNADGFEGLARRLQRWDGSLAELLADCRTRLAHMRALPAGRRRQLVNAANRWVPLPAE